MISITSEEMRKIERTAFHHFHIEFEQMMENAGSSVASFARTLLKDVEGQRVAILVGKGNNGGDGLVAARFLQSWGAEVTIIIPFQGELIKSELTKRNLKTAEKMGIRIHVMEDYSDIRTQDILKNSQLIIDALLGYGIEGVIEGILERLIEYANQADVPILSIDVPSGIDADTGEVMGEAIKATYTLTLGLPKKGLFLNKENPGEIYLADIGIPSKVYDHLDIDTRNIFNRKNIIKVKEESA